MTEARWRQHSENSPPCFVRELQRSRKEMAVYAHFHRFPLNKVKSISISPNDTQAKYTEQSTTYVPALRGALCRLPQAERGLMGAGCERCSNSRGCMG